MSSWQDQVAAAEDAGELYALGTRMAEEIDALQSQLEDRKKKCLELEKELAAVTDLIDDVLYDPTWKPVDETGQPIKGNAMYLLEHPVQKDHMPALREWFVKRYGGVTP